MVNTNINEVSRVQAAPGRPRPGVVVATLSKTDVKAWLATIEILPEKVNGAEISSCLVRPITPSSCLFRRGTNN